MIEINRSLPGASIPVEPIPVKIVGVGGAGSSALDRLLLDGADATDLVAVNTDVQSLTASVAAQKVQLGNALTHGLGAGGDPEVGMAAAEAALPDIRESIEGAKVVFVVAGLGGGTGSGAAPYVAHAAREEGALVIGVVTLPFAFEGRRRGAQAATALDQLRQLCHAVICFENDRMSELVVPKAGIQQAFVAADHTMSECIRAVLAMISRPGIMKVGLDDLLTVLRTDEARCLFGHGEAEGDNRAHEALARALKNPLMERGRLLEGAANVLVYVTGSSNLTLGEVEMLMTELNRHVGDSTHLLLGTAIEPRLGAKLTVTLITSLGTSIPLNLPASAAPLEIPAAVVEIPTNLETSEDATLALPGEEPPVPVIPPVTARPAVKPRAPRPAPEPAPSAAAPVPEKTPQIRQETLQFEPISRGRFEKSEPTIVEGHDLDVPTILRKGFRI